MVDLISLNMISIKDRLTPSSTISYVGSISFFSSFIIYNFIYLLSFIYLLFIILFTFIYYFYYIYNNNIYKRLTTIYVNDFFKESPGEGRSIFNFEKIKILSLNMQTLKVKIKIQQYLIL